MEAQADNVKSVNEVESTEVDSAVKDSADIKKPGTDIVPDTEPAVADSDAKTNDIEPIVVDNDDKTDENEPKVVDNDTKALDSEPKSVENEAKSDDDDGTEQEAKDETAGVDKDIEKEADADKVVEDIGTDNNNEKTNKDVPESIPSTVDDESTEEKQNTEDTEEKEQSKETVEDTNVGTEASVTETVGSGSDKTEEEEELPPPAPETPPPAPETPPPADDPPADDPPSYDAEENEQPEEDTPAEPEDEPEADRPPSPDTVIPVVTSHNFHPRLCIIRKWPDFQGYGFNLHAEKEKKGQYIGLVDANSPAEDCDLRKGDRIIEVNGDNIEDDTHQQVIQKIKAGGEVARMLVVDKEADDYFKNNGIQVTADMQEVITNETRQRESSAMTFVPRSCHVIKRPDFPGYGFNLHAEKERGGQYIGQIDNNSPAQEAGLKEHDRIIEVNGENIENETHQQVIGRIKSGGDETKLLVVDREADNYFKSRGTTVMSSMPEVKHIQSTRPSPRTSAVTNGDSSPAPAPVSQPTRVFSRKKAPTPPGSPDKTEDIFTLSAHDIRNHIQRKKSDKRLKRTSIREKVNIFEEL